MTNIKIFIKKAWSYLFPKKKDIKPVLTFSEQVAELTTTEPQKIKKPAKKAATKKINNKK